MAKIKSRERRLFIHVQGLGVCDANGRNTSISYGFKRHVGDGEKPISSLFVPYIQEALEMCSWPTEEAMLADLKLLLRYAQEVYDNEVEACNTTVNSPAKSPNDGG
jgi:hypothetical protein